MVPWDHAAHGPIDLGFSQNSQSCDTYRSRMVDIRPMARQFASFKSFGPSRIRTYDQGIMSPLL